MGYPVWDKLQNLVSGLMSRADKAQHDLYYFVPLTKNQIECAYRTDWITRKAVDIPPYDSTRAWRDWQAEDNEIEELENEEKRLFMRQRVARAATLARLYGGAAIYLGVDQGLPSDELRVDRVKKGSLRYLHVFTRHELVTGELEQDPLSPNFGAPKEYRLHSQKGEVRIHPSRIVRFIGNEVPDPTLSSDGWGDSVVQVLDDAIKAAGLTAQSIASLVHEAKVDVIHVPRLAELLSTDDGTAQLTRRMGMAAALKSNMALMLLAGGGENEMETWERKEISFGGLRDVLQLYLQIASGAADIPATRLLGQAPAGLNATGDSDIRNYYDMISSRQEVELRPLMERIDAVLIPSTFGSAKRDIWFEFTPLWQMTEAEKATIAKTQADTTAVYANAGVLPSDALAKGVQNLLVESGFYPGLESALEEAEAALSIEPLLTEEERAQEQLGAPVKPEEVKKIAADAALRPSSPRIVVDDSKGGNSSVESYAIIDGGRTMGRYRTYPGAQTALARMLKRVGVEVSPDDPAPQTEAEEKKIEEK